MADGVVSRRGGKRPGAGRKPGSRGKIQIEAQVEALKWGPAAMRAAAHMAGLADEKGRLTKVFGGKGGDPHGKAESEAVRKSALDTILERAYGKPAQPLNHGDNEGRKLPPAVVDASKLSKKQLEALASIRIYTDRG